MYFYTYMQLYKYTNMKVTFRLSHLVTCSTFMSYSPWTFFPRKALALHEKRERENQGYMYLLSAATQTLLVWPSVSQNYMSANEIDQLHIESSLSFDVLVSLTSHVVIKSLTLFSTLNCILKDTETHISQLVTTIK